MYSAASRPPRVAGARPSSRSELRKRRCPSISAVVMRWRCCCAAASAGVTNSTRDRNERRVGIGALREWENDGQYIASLTHRKTRPRADRAPPSGARRRTLGAAPNYPHRKLDMLARIRTALPFALALTLASAAIASPARAQDAALAPSPVTASTAPPLAATPAPAGPTMDAAAVGVRHTPVATTPAAPRAGYRQPVAPMVVGGAAVLVGLIIGGDGRTGIRPRGAPGGFVRVFHYLPYARERTPIG